MHLCAISKHALEIEAATNEPRKDDEKAKDNKHLPFPD